MRRLRKYRYYKGLVKESIISRLHLLLSSGDCRSNLIGRRSSSMGVVSSDVMCPLPSRLIVGLSTKDNELHSSEVGETSGVSVVGVTEPGRKKCSKPSPISRPILPAHSAFTSGRVGARVLARLGRPLTRCCNWNDALGSSVIESQHSSTPPSSIAALLSLTKATPPAVAVAATPPAPRADNCELEERCDEGDSSKSGMWLRLRFSTTDCGRTRRGTERRLLAKCGVAWAKEGSNN